MSCSRRSGDPTPAGTQDPETPLDSALVGGSCHSSTRAQPVGEAGGLRRRAPGLRGVYSEEEAVSDLQEEAWAGGDLCDQMCSVLAEYTGGTLVSWGQVGHSRVPWTGP